MVGDAQGDYYGESSGSFIAKEFSLYEELNEIFHLASQSIPERPDGIVYTSGSRQEC
jgi:excinuclease UvrABC helicase subunit UvrB